jgi:ABC-2 type transport system ATP-binding protein
MLTVQGVTKVYGSRKAVDNISFTLGDHEILGFLGPNGAGKSTAMNIIAGYTSATAGTVTLNGHEILDDPVGCKKQTGYLPERPPLYPDMTVNAYLSFMFDLKKIRLPKKDHLAEICSAASIAGVRNRLVKNLSKGFQQRVGLAQAILGYPCLLILDEPTVGLDPKQILETRDLIREMGKRCAVIFSSHILQEIQAVCERIIVINNGVLAADGSPAELARTASGDNRLLLTAEGPAEELRAALTELPGTKAVEFQGQGGDGGFEFALEVEEGTDLRRDIFRLLAEKGWPLLSLRKSGMSLEDLFFRLTAGDNSALAAFSRPASSGGTDNTPGTAGELES